MRKLYALIAVFALLLPALAGCQSSVPATTNNTETTQTAATAPQDTLPPEASPTETVDRIAPEEAVNIALKDANLKESQVHDLDVELDRDAGTLHYDVDFEKEDKDYDYEIDAVSGAILKKETPAKAASTTPANTDTPKKTTEKKQLTKNEARDVALKHAGLTTSQVRDLEVELDKDDGTIHYDVDFESDGYDYDYEIDAATGKILKSTKERD